MEQAAKDDASSQADSEEANSCPSSPGITVGEYENCHLIAEGLCSKIYKHQTPGQTYALKVTEVHPPAPHNPRREARILFDPATLHNNVVHISDSFDHHGEFVIVMPYEPLTLEHLISKGSLSMTSVLSIFTDLFSALEHLHRFDIIHRDIKPSNILLTSLIGPAILCDFGTAWHPGYSLAAETPDAIIEPADVKVIEVGTGPYRAPETLFGNKSYGASLDIWSAGCVLTECLRSPPSSLFKSPPTWEDGNQLGLILSIFKTLGTPTRKTWPEAEGFKTKPFDWYTMFPAKSWEELLPEREDWDLKGKVEWNGWRELVKGCVAYESGTRMEARDARITLGEISKALK